MTSTSLGPAGMSILDHGLAVGQQHLGRRHILVPGPKDLVHLGTGLSAQAIAATACAPPAFSMWVTPAFFAQSNTSGVMLPSGRGGVASTTVPQPAICAGTANIKALLGKTAVPPGTDKPTAGQQQQQQRQQGVHRSA